MPILGSQSSGTKGAPTSPTIGTATVTNSTTVSLTFTDPSSKLPITSYTAASSPSISLSTSGTTSPVTITGTFASGTAYTFTLAAVNANGTSTASSASNSVTPYVVPKTGYVMGGYSGSVIKSTVIKITFSNDTISSLGAIMPAARRYGHAGFANSGTAGYSAGGINSAGSMLSSILKLTFTGDSVSTIASTLSTNANMNCSAFANSGTAGYVSNGTDGGTPSRIVNKITFSNDSRSTLAAELSEYGHERTGFANSGTAGYLAGGNSTGVNINKILFSNDAVSSLGASLAGFRSGSMSAANSGTAGYIAGRAGNNESRIDKLTFSNDSTSTISATISRGRGYGVGFANSGTAGYFVAGYSTADSGSSSIDKIAFSNDTRSVLSETLPSGMNELQQTAGFANSGAL